MAGRSQKSFSLGARKSTASSVTSNNAETPEMSDIQKKEKIWETDQAGFWAPDSMAMRSPKHMSVSEIYEAHKESSQWLELALPDAQARQSMVEQFPSGVFFQLIIDVQMVMFRAGVDNILELYFSLYNRDFDQYLSEEFCARITPHGFPVNGKPESVKCMFKNLKKEELEGNVHLVIKVIRYGDMILEEGAIMGGQSATSNKSKKGIPRYRRPYAIGIMSLNTQRTYLLKSLFTGEPHKYIDGRTSSEAPVPIFTPNEEIKFPELHKLIIDNHTSDYKVPQRSNGIALEYSLYAGTVDSVRDSYEHFDMLTFLDHLTPQVVDDAQRNLMFLNVEHCSITPRWGKTAPQNIEVRVELRSNEDQEPLIKRLQIGKGQMAEKKSMLYSQVFYHFNEPSFSDPMTIHLPDTIEELEKCHIFLTFAHCRTSNKKRDDPLAFAFFDIYNRKLGHILPSGCALDLEVWKYKSSINYIQNADNLSSTNHRCTIKTNLCSTKMTCDPEIHKFLSWKLYPPEAMINCVKGLAKKPTEALTAVFREVLDSLFGILARNTHEGLSETCYEVLVSILNDICKAGQKAVIPVLEKWIEKQFACPDVWRTLLFNFLKTIHWVGTTEANPEPPVSPQVMRTVAERMRVLSNSMRGSKYLFKIIQKSYLIKPDSKTFKAMLNKVFNAIFRMMLLKKPKMIVGLQGFTLQNFLDFIQCLPDHSSSDLVNIVMHFLKSVRNADTTKKVAALDRLMLIVNFLDLPDIQPKDVIKRALPVIVDIVGQHIDNGEEEALACGYILKSCTRYLNPGLMQRSQAHEGSGPPPPPGSAQRGSARGSTLTIAPTEDIMQGFVELLLRFFGVFKNLREINIKELTLVNKVKKMKSKRTTHDGDDFDVLMLYRDLFVCMAEMSRAIMVDPQDPGDLQRRHVRVDQVLVNLRENNQEQFETIINTVLQTAVGLLKNSLFPEEWVHMRFIEAELCLRSFSWFEFVLNTHYIEGDAFNQDLWVPYIQLGMRVLSEPTFDLENMIDGRRQIIVQYYGDMREGALRQLSSVWECLREKHHVLARELVGAAVDAGRSKIEGVWRLSVTMYFDMMRSEFEQEGRIRSVEHQTIDEIDHLTTQYFNTPDALLGYEQFFKERVRNKLTEASRDMQVMCNAFLDEVQKLFSLLVSLKGYPKTREFEDERADAMFELIQYLDDSEKSELLMRYQYEYGLMQQDLKNFAEAANSFKRVGDMLEWSDKILKPYMTADPKQSLEQETETKRRVAMYNRARDFYMRAEFFEKSIESTEHLIDVYQNVLFDLNELADWLQKQAMTWRMIANADRVFLACYLVTYRGDFPDDVKGMSFVYRSGMNSKTEGIRDFTDRIKGKWPAAQVKNSGNPIPDEFEDPNFAGQFIQITTLQVSHEDEIEGGTHPWDSGHKKRAPMRLKKYYQQNEINTFFYTYVMKERRVKGENEFRTIWVTKTFITTEQNIPDLRRRIPVMRITQKIIGPLMNAVEKIEEKNVHVKGVITTVRNDLSHNTADLSMNLNGIIDAAVMGGIDKYREAFFDGTYFAQYPQEIELGAAFKRALGEQLEIVEEGMAVFGEHCPEDLLPLKEHLDEMFQTMKTNLSSFINEA